MNVVSEQNYNHSRALKSFPFSIHEISHRNAQKWIAGWKREKKMLKDEEFKVNLVMNESVIARKLSVKFMETIWAPHVFS